MSTRSVKNAKTKNRKQENKGKTKGRKTNKTRVKQGDGSLVCRYLPQKKGSSSAIFRCSQGIPA